MLILLEIKSAVITSSSIWLSRVFPPGTVTPPVPGFIVAPPPKVVPPPAPPVDLKPTKSTILVPLIVALVNLAEPEASILQAPSFWEIPPEEILQLPIFPVNA